jgi:hypothetical protein
MAVFKAQWLDNAERRRLRGPIWQNAALREQSSVSI